MRPGGFSRDDVIDRVSTHFPVREGGRNYLAIPSPVGQMKTRFDIKSIAAGLGAGVALTFLLGAAVPQLNYLGRFQVAGSGAFFVIVDTVTGRAWVGDFHTIINNPIPSEHSGGDAQQRFFLPKPLEASPRE